jgi:hypothetical protein
LIHEKVGGGFPLALQVTEAVSVSTTLTEDSILSNVGGV